MILRARRKGGEAQQDLYDLVRVNVNRLIYIQEVAGLILLGVVCFVLSSLVILAFYYNQEFAQAVFLLLFPLTLVGALSLRTAHIIYRDEPLEEALYTRLMRHRVAVQFIGMASVFVTAMWGMYKNLTVSPLF